VLGLSSLRADEPPEPKGRSSGSSQTSASVPTAPSSSTATVSGRPVPAKASPPVPGPDRDPRLWPRGYFPGDPLPPSTIYLTFDDGPTEFTPAILDILKEEGVHATFFICGQAPSLKKTPPARQTAAQPEPAGSLQNAGTTSAPHASPAVNYLLQYSSTIRRMIREGHVIGNHCYSHTDLGRQSAGQIDFQISTVNSQLKTILGSEMPELRFIRPPFGSPWLGSWNTAVQREKVCRALGSKGIVVLWTEGWDSSDSTDWAQGEWFAPEARRYHPDTESYAEKMNREMRRLLKRADGKQSGIILMHDTHPTSRDILKALIIEYKRRGYSFGTLEDYAEWRWPSSPGR